MSRAAVLVVAAGEGRRFGGAKQFAAFGGRPLVEWSLEAFQAHPGIEEIVLVLSETRTKKAYLERYPKISEVVLGGERRQDSVRIGFGCLDCLRTGFVLVHDGARPLVSSEIISRVLTRTKKEGAVIPVVPVEDTIKEISEGRVVRTLDRGRLGRVQTPQGFSYELLKQALDLALKDGFSGPDEAVLVERLGAAVATVAGDPRNIKITTPLDLIFAEAIRYENRSGV
jgi:2-C-methyl-D-erythritol 4-phosphate cytidylyltransferase